MIWKICSSTISGLQLLQTVAVMEFLFQPCRTRRPCVGKTDSKTESMYTVTNACPCLPLPAVESHFANLPLMAEWTDVPLDHREAGTPAKYWKAIRCARDKVTVFDYAESPITSCFALRIALCLPKEVRLASTVKPLIDGVVCAFHGEDARCLACLTDFCVRQCCEKLAVPNQFPAVLGKREFIRPYRGGRSVLWDPADDLCRLALITVSYGTEDSLFSGEIYKLPEC